MAWRLAKSLERLRTQVDAVYPNRSKRDDGTIGDEAHASRSSDHNPWVKDGPTGVVTAMDLTHDPRGGFDSYKFADQLRAAHDPRLKYVISNRRIWNPAVSPDWRPYNGTNPHDHHVHISVKPGKAFYDSNQSWVLVGGEEVDLAAPRMGLIHYMIAQGSQGALVLELQTLLGIEADGDFGPATADAVKHFQSSHSLVPDGKVGVYTWKVLLA